jgi:hypothetical protein
MRSLRSLALLAPPFSLAAFLPAPPLVAQVPDSGLFHPGQWGVDFRIGSGFAGAGALHFTSPTHATLLDLSGGYNHTSNTAASAAGLRTSNVSGVLSLGRRAYHRVDPHVHRWTTFGFSFLYNRQSSTQGTVTQTSRGVGTGVFVNIGGMWLVTPHLGLGGQWQVDLTYTHNGTSARTTSDVVTVGLARVALTGQFYF